VTTPSVRLSPEDDAYIRAHFVSLDWLAERSGIARLRLAEWQERGLFPRPTYVTDDKQEWYPPAYAELVRRATTRKTDLKTLFELDFSRALEGLRRSDPAEYRAELAGPGGTEMTPEADIAASWEGFLSGEFGACLRVAWVPCMLRKAKLMRAISELAAKPELDDPSWRSRLRHAVDALDRLEMPFARWDRFRFGKPVSRDTHIEAVRLRFPAVFGRKGSPQCVDAPDSPTVTPEELPC
jgi:hypothetical protein